MKRIVMLVLCFVLVVSFVSASEAKSLFQLSGIKNGDVVRISVRSGTSGRTVAVIESTEIIDEIIKAADGKYIPIDKSEGVGAGGWLYNLKFYTDIFSDPAFEYTLSSGSTCIDGEWYELEDESELLETVKKYMDDPFSYEGIMVGSGSPAANMEIIVTPGEETVNAYGMDVRMDSPAVIRDDRMFVPLRFVAEMLGATVNWNGDEKTVFVKHGVTEMVLKIGSDAAIVNGREYILQNSPFILYDRTYVPLRFIAELTGAEVIWREGRGDVVITRVI